MSWLFKTLQSDSPTSTTPDDAVKDDFSVIGHTIGRQLRGVAAFLAPPPTSAEQPAAPSESRSPQSEALVGIRNDLAEIGGSFKSGLSLLSSNKAVTGISKFASKLLQYQDDDHGGGDRIPGITEEVLGFVKEISERSECWIDFPLSLNDGKVIVLMCSIIYECNALFYVTMLLSMLQQLIVYILHFGSRLMVGFVPSVSCPNCKCVILIHSEGQFYVL